MTPLPLPPPRPEIRLIVFDFDGTLSWLRHGWPGMMCDAAVEFCPGLAGARPQMLEEILALNGQPSIHQCAKLVEMMTAHGGAPMEPEKLRLSFQARLDEAIARRVGRIRAGEVESSGYVVAGALEFLQAAQQTGRTLAILSTTTHERVEEEATLFGLRGFFGRHVYGSRGDARQFSKRVVFEQMLQEEGWPGAHLLSFGDGPVELRETKSLGGVAIGVCSDEEENGSGVCDPHKQAGLLAVGADAVIPDYRGARPLLRHLLGA